MTENFEVKNIDDWNSLLQKAENGNTDAMNEVAFWYENGLTLDNVEIIKLDKKLAFEWTKKSFESGNIDGVVRYADYLTDRENTVCKIDIDLGMRLYEQAISEGSSNATYSLGLEYRNKQQFDTAFELYLKAEKSESFYKTLQLGYCYYYGIGTKKNRKKAFEFFSSINHSEFSEYEIEDANYMIGLLYLEGSGVKKSLSKAREYFELADIDNDHRSAQEMLILIGRTKLIN